MKPAWRRALRWALALACLGYVGWFFYDQRQQLDRLLTIEPPLLLGVIAATLLSDLVGTYRFRLFVAACSGRALPFFAFFRLLMIGRFLNTLAAQSGNVYRALTLKRQHGVAYGRYLSALLAMAWLGIAQDLLTGGVLLAAWGAALGADRWPLAALLLLGAPAVLAGPPLAAGLLARVDPAQPRLRRLLAMLRGTLEPMLAAARRPGLMIEIAASGIALFGSTLLMLYLLFLALGIYPGFIGLSVFVILLRLSGVVTVTPGNIGLRELAFGFLADQLGVGMAQGLLASALMRAVGMSTLMVTSALLGGPALLRGGSRRDAV